MRVTLGLITALSLTGCANYGRVMDQNISVVPSDKGIVLFSTEANRASITSPIALSLIDAERDKEVPTSIIIDSPVLPSDFEGVHGNVRSLTLNAGRYYLVPRAVSPYQCLRSRPQYEFSVRAGEVIYIGSFRRVGNALDHTPSENQDRDLEFFLRRNPALSQSDVKLGDASLSRAKHSECP